MFGVFTKEPVASECWAIGAEVPIVTWPMELKGIDSIADLAIRDPTLVPLS